MFSPQEIATITGGTWLRSPISKEPLIGGAFDTKKICEEQIFFAQKGENADAHSYLHQIQSDSSIRLIIVEHERFNQPFSEGIAILKVPNSLDALHKIATARVEKFEGKIIAITGSSGKTTTKNWLAKILSQKFSVLFSPQSFNNHLGCPISILSITPKTEICILEMGTSGLGEIENLTRIANPHYSVLLNIGHAHIGKLGNRKNILQAKSEIFTHMVPPSVAFLPKNISPEQASEAKKIVFFGTGAEHYSPQEKTSKLGRRRFSLSMKQGMFSFETDLIGEQVGENLAAVFAVAEELGMTPAEIKIGMAGLENLPGRGKLVEGSNQSLIFDDSYNANPESVLNFLKTIDSISAPKKIAVIGNLSEQDSSLNSCRKILQNKIPESIDTFLLTGSTAENLQKILLDSGIKREKIFICLTERSLLLKTQSFLMSQSLIGVKASRSSKLDILVKKIQNY